MTSARRLEQRIREDLGLRYLAGGQRPDNWALSAFRRRHGRALNDVFTRHLSIKLCLSDSCGSLEAGLEDGIELWKYRTDGPARSFPTALLQGGDS